MWMTSSVCESDLPSHHLLSDSIHCTGYDAASSMAHLLRSGSEHRGHFQPAKAKGPKIPYHLHKRHRAGWTEVFVAVGRLVPERFLVEASPPFISELRPFSARALRAGRFALGLGWCSGLWLWWLVGPFFKNWPRRGLSRKRVKMPTRATLPIQNFQHPVFTF